MDAIRETQPSAAAGTERWLLRVEEVAELLGVSRSSIYALLAKSAIPSVKISGCRRIAVGELREWLKQQSA